VFFGYGITFFSYFSSDERAFSGAAVSSGFILAPRGTRLVESSLFLISYLLLTIPDVFTQRSTEVIS
jgi:hypothetical protein